MALSGDGECCLNGSHSTERLFSGEQLPEHDAIGIDVSSR